VVGTQDDDIDLVTLVLGLVCTAEHARLLAVRLIEEFIDASRVLTANSEELERVAGITELHLLAIRCVDAAALRLIKLSAYHPPILSGSKSLIDYLHALMAHRTTEELRVIFLDVYHALIRDESISEGTIDATAAYPREILKRALELGASSIILVHNHPSGDPSPSWRDQNLTSAVVAAAKSLDIIVHDHIVIGRNGHSSFRALGLL